MKDFKKLIKILLKRNYLWILLLLIITTLGVAVDANLNLNSTIMSIATQNSRINWMHENMGKEFASHEDYEKSSAVIYEENTEIEEKMRFGEYSTKEFKENRDKYRELLAYHNVSPEEFRREVIEYNSEFDNMMWTTKNDAIELSHYNGFFYDEVDIYSDSEDLEFNVASDIAGENRNLTIIIFIFVLSLLLTSLEHFTPYYEFTRLFPWSSGKNYLMKIAFGLIIVLPIYFLSVAINYGVWSNSTFSEILVFKGVYLGIFKEILVYISIFLILMAIGEVSGNVLGHIGLMIIVFNGISLITTNIKEIVSMFIELSGENIFAKIEKLTWNSPIFNVIYSPFSAVYSDYLSSVVTFFVLALIIFALGYYWAKKAKPERTGMLIRDKLLSNYSFILAVITTANLLASVFTFSIGNFPNFLTIAIFAIALLLSYKIYKILFNTRIGA